MGIEGRGAFSPDFERRFCFERETSCEQCSSCLPSPPSLFRFLFRFVSVLPVFRCRSRPGWAPSA